MVEVTKCHIQEVVCLVQQAVRIVLLELVLLLYVQLVIIVQILHKKPFVPPDRIVQQAVRRLHLVLLEHIIPIQEEHQAHLVLPVQLVRIVQ